MKYENLYQEFKDAVPECKEFCSQIEMKMQLDDTDGMYIYYGFVVAPYIVKTVLEGNQLVIP